MPSALIYWNAPNSAQLSPAGHTYCKNVKEDREHKTLSYARAMQFRQDKEEELFAMLR